MKERKLAELNKNERYHSNFSIRFTNFVEIRNSFCVLFT